MSENYREEQLSRISSALDKVTKDNKNILDVDIEYLKQYLSVEDIAVFYKILFEHIYTKKQESSLKTKKSETPVFEWEEITPYTILGIEKKDYSKEELLDIVQHKINYINKYERNPLKKQQQIDSILDAYNEIIKTTSYKK